MQVNEILKTLCAAATRGNKEKQFPQSLINSAKTKTDFLHRETANWVEADDGARLWSLAVSCGISWPFQNRSHVSIYWNGILMEKNYCTLEMTERTAENARFWV